MTTIDNVNHPTHYNQYKGFEVIDVCEQLHSPDGGGNYNRGNAFKYLARAGWKSPEREIEDLEKCKFYVEREIERIKAGIAVSGPEQVQEDLPTIPETVLEKYRDVVAPVRTGTGYWCGYCDHEMQQGLQPHLLFCDNPQHSLSQVILPIPGVTRDLRQPEIPLNDVVAPERDHAPEVTEERTLSLPGCSVCGVEEEQDPENNYALYCPNPECDKNPTPEAVIKTHPLPVVGSAKIPVQRQSHLSSRATTSFERYQNGPTDEYLNRDGRAHLNERDYHESMVQGADEESSEK